MFAPPVAAQRIQPLGEDCSDRPAPLRPRHDFGGRYLATAGHADHATAQFVDPSEVSYPYTLGFVLPTEAHDNVVLDLGIDNWTHEHAVFAGSIAVG
jgi:hypothetical protein